MIRAFLARLIDPAFILLRIFAGLMFAQHGVQKLFGLLGGMVQPVGSQLWIGAIIELITGLLIAIGFQTVWAALLASGQMAVAYLQFHWQFHIDSRFFPAVNKGELALLFCFVFFYIACRSAAPPRGKTSAAIASSRLAARS
jgi:putative oxidoreductase